MMPTQVLEMVVAHPDPAGLRLLQVLITAMAIGIAILEHKGEGPRYSKFARDKARSVPSKYGMAILYSPAAVLCSGFLLSKLSSSAPGSPPPPHASAMAFTAPADHRLLIFAAALAIHFSKRLLEVFFVHKYSGSIEMSWFFIMVVSYIAMSVSLLYAQQLYQHLHPPALNLMGLGVCVFLAGSIGNFYHHFLLAKLRSNKKNKSDYVTPRGGLFTWVVCPHYLFECITFLGIALIGQTSTAFVNALSTFIILSARSQTTKLWYKKKIEDFPTARKAMLPFLF